MSEWAVGEIYESYVGRWSRAVAAEFIRWLDQPPGLRWLDVGCGTGALTSTVLSSADPARVLGVDPSAGFVEYARQQVTDERAEFQVRSAGELPDERFDVIVSGLVLNFLPDPVAALRRFRELGPTVAVYVWDYAEGMQLMRHFWDAAIELRPEDAVHDEGPRFPICTEPGLRDAFGQAGFTAPEVGAIEIPTVFGSFEEYWTPFLGGQGIAPAYLRTLSEPDQLALRDAVRARLPSGQISLTARAWTCRADARH